MRNQPAWFSSALEWLMGLWRWVEDYFLAPERIAELAVIATALWLGRLAGRFLLSFFDELLSEVPWWQKRPEFRVRGAVSTAIALLLMWTGRLALEPVMEGQYLLPLATSLTAAWLVIRISVSFIAKREVRRFVAIGIWSLAALNILGLLPQIIEVLDGASLTMGASSVSILDVLTGLFTFAALIWAALALSRLVDARLQKARSVPASAGVLISKTNRIVLLALAVLISLNATGIDLTALAVFGGALGVGIGFGLQKVVGNFISGLILLLDRSIKPGDVIETGGTYGRINKLAARYTSVITRDGTEYLIPNEDMITQAVVNWSHSNLLVRRRIPVQVSYDSDLDQAMKLMNWAAAEESRVLANPAPRTLIRGFGADGVDLELRFWIKDPQNGVSNISSDVMAHIWRAFHDEEMREGKTIEFPFPQRVVHFADKPPSPKD